MSAIGRVACAAAVVAWVALASAVDTGAIRPAAAQSKVDDESAFLVDEARKAIRARAYDKAGKLLDRALKIDPRRIQAYILRASVHGVRGENELAVAVMRRAERLAPDNVDVLTALGSQLMLAKRFDEAVPLLERVVGMEPDRYEAQVQLGHYYAKQGEWRAAIAAFEAYFASRPAVLAREDATHHAGLANAYLRVGDPGAARDLYREILRDQPESVIGRLGLAWSTAAIDCRRALSLLAGMSDLAASYPEVTLVEGRCRLALGQLDRALDIAVSYRGKRPEDVYGLAFLADARTAAGDLTGAYEALTAAVGRAPENRRLSMKLARIERLMGHPQAAAARLRGAGPASGEEEEWTLELGEALLADAQYERVRELIGAFETEHPDDPHARVLLGLAMMKLGDSAGAAEELRRAIALDPQMAERARKPLADALDGEAIAAIERGDLGTAEERLSLSRGVLEDNGTLCNLGLVRIRAGRPADAIEPLEKASASGTDHRALHLLGRALAAAGRLADARAALERSRAAAARATKDRTWISLDLAAVLLEQKHAEAAAEVLEQLLAAPADASTRARVVEAYYKAVSAAMAEQMGAGAFRHAYRMGARLDPYLSELSPASAAAASCDLALAATGAGLREIASRRVSELVDAKATCPFAPPADALAVPILQAWTDGLRRGRAGNALNRLDHLQRRATGSAHPLLRAAYRDVAIRAAVDAYEHDNLAVARVFLRRLRRIDGSSPELAYNEAVLRLAAGKKTEEVIARLTRVVGDVPEAHVSLGIAYDRLGERVKALDQYRKAVDAGVRHPGLNEWIADKERIWGEGQ